MSRKIEAGTRKSLEFPASFSFLTPTLCCLILVAVVCITFLQLIHFDFVYLDDERNLYNNRLITSFQWGNLAGFWSHPYGEIYRPSIYSLWLGIGILFRLPSPTPITPFPETTELSAGAYHAFGVGLHAATSIVLFLLLRRIVKDNLGALAGAIIFAVHPIQVEAVAWISAMNYSLGGMFGFLSLLLYVTYRENVSSAEGNIRLLHRYASYVGALASFLLSLTALPLAVAIPFFAFAIDYWQFGRSIKQALLSLSPFFLLAGIWVVVTSAPMPLPAAVTAVPAWTRPFVAGDSLVQTALHILWPICLGIDYGRTPAYISSHPNVWGEIALPLLLTVLVAFFIKSKRAKMIWWCFFAGLLPVLGIIPFEYQQYSTVADRYAYLSFFALSIGVGELVSHRVAGKYTTPLFLLVAVALTGGTFLQSLTWYNSVTLFKHAAEVNPESFPSYTNLGVTYLLSKRPDLALNPLRKALELRPDDFGARQNVALSLFRLRRDDEAIPAIRSALELQPDDPSMQHLLELAISRSGP